MYVWENRRILGVKSDKIYEWDGTSSLWWEINSEIQQSQETQYYLHTTWTKFGGTSKSVIHFCESSKWLWCFICFEKRKTRRSLVDSLRNSPQGDRKPIHVILFSFPYEDFLIWFEFEYFKCERNQGHPKCKKHVWGPNYEYHYKRCPFGCSTPEGKRIVLTLSSIF